MAAGALLGGAEEAGAAAGVGEAGAAESGGGLFSRIFGAEAKGGGGAVGRFFGTAGTGGGRGGRWGRAGRGGKGRRDPDDTHNNDAPSFLERLWQAEASADLFERVRSITGTFPTYTEGVVVNVFGGKGSSLAGLYYLALSAAWGAIDPVPLFGAPIVVKMYVNRTARHVMAQISYSVKSTLIGLATQSLSANAILQKSASLNSSKIFFPPPEEVVGGHWSDKLTIISATEKATSAVGVAVANALTALKAGVPLPLTDVDVIEAANLGEFQERIITTPTDHLDLVRATKHGGDYYELNPSPVFDGLTRDSDPTAIITQALWNPELEDPPKPRTHYRYIVQGHKQRFDGIVNAAGKRLVDEEITVPAKLELPKQVLEQIEDDQANQNYTGKPLDPPDKTL